ncbi:mitogen-activated protein kinase kinase kinase 5-like isoform X2 [Hibiscus syriacus]|uniref:mitogen-activated protein kinase kinase kinase 5-like isoform X2 n=1 Tax=Hibiscus syriacus TaxID=106335 RepID=UPI001923AEAA|nr:mitogen-activated protein kinase kinase kinase 5-like isoform X2 [Hibiscus syriacus]
MSCFHNISFSSLPSRSSSSPSLKYSEDNNNHCQRNQRPKSRYYLGFSIAGSRFRRHREPRRLTDQEVPHKEESVVSQQSDGGCETQSSSPSRASKSFSSSSSALAVPLPLPLPVPDGDGEQRLLSLMEVGHCKGLEDRDTDKADETTASLIDEFASRDLRKTTKNVETISSSRAMQQELIKGDSYQDEFMVHFPISSAPTSQIASPVATPQRLSAADVFPHYIAPACNQFWSAPEMKALDVAGLPSRTFHDYNAFTTDHTPPHSSPNRSPTRSNRSQSGPTSPIHGRLSLESIDMSSLRPECNGHIFVHPLPRPPGAGLASPPASMSQVANKPESLPMNSKWRKGKLIGRGTFGSVYVASNRETGALCAMKEVDIFTDDPKSAECIKQLEQEIKVLSHLKHPNIVQYYGSEKVEDKFYIYLEYVHPGSINKYVLDHCGAITESVVRNFTRHILSGLAYLHSTKTIHRDIKGANLLVDASGVVKLADFGMSKHLTGERADLSLKGSPYWMAPELMQAVMQKDNSSKLALAVDIWSLGCTIIEMYTGKAPWSEYEGAAAMFKVMRDTPPIPETLSSEGKDFLRCCFKRKPAERPSASLLLEHRFVKSPLQSGASPSASSFNGIKDAPLSPVERSEFKLVQLPVQTSLQSSKPVTPDSKTAQRSHYKHSELSAAPRCSPRSSFEVPPSLYSPSSGPNTHHPIPSNTVNRSNNQESKKNHNFR